MVIVREYNVNKDESITLHIQPYPHNKLTYLTKEQLEQVIKSKYNVIHKRGENLVELFSTDDFKAVKEKLSKLIETNDSTDIEKTRQLMFHLKEHNRRKTLKNKFNKSDVTATASRQG